MKGRETTSQNEDTVDNTDDEMVFDVRENALFKIGLLGVSTLAAYSLQFIGVKFGEIFSGVSIGTFETITGAIAIAVSLGHFVGRSAEDGAKNSLIAYTGLAIGLGIVAWQSFSKGSNFRLIIPTLTLFVAFLHMGDVFKQDVKLEGLFNYFGSLNKIISYGAPGYLALLALKIYGVPMAMAVLVPFIEFLGSISPI